MNTYAAGGAIRDLLFGQPIRDVDYVFSETEDEFIQRNPAARKIQNDACTTYLLDGQEFTPLEQADPAKDVLRRDFTINALLLSENGVLHMHPDAMDDLKNRCIRAVSSSAIATDPIRAFRAARFTAKYPDCTLHKETLSQMRALAQECADTEEASDIAASLLSRIAPEQIGNETRKACLTMQPGNFLRSLEQGDCLKPWFCEFFRGAAIPAGFPARHGISVLEHTATVMDATAVRAEQSAAKETERALAVWMALCHSIGKTETPNDMLPCHCGHEIRGGRLAEALGLCLRLPAAFVKAGKLSATLLLKAKEYRQLRSGSKVDLLMTLHASALLHPFLHMAAAASGQDRLPHPLQNDLDTLLRVKLPQQWQNKGNASGRKLRELRCAALGAL